MRHNNQIFNVVDKEWGGQCGLRIHCSRTGTAEAGTSPAMKVLTEPGGVCTWPAARPQVPPSAGLLNSPNAVAFNTVLHAVVTPNHKINIVDSS